MARPADLALTHYAGRQQLLAAVGAVAGQAWSTVDPDQIAQTWAAQVPRLTVAVSAAQTAAAGMSEPYVLAQLEAQDLDDAAFGEVVPKAFGGVASDGRSLMSLLLNPAFTALSAIGSGYPVDRAMAAGRANADMIARTQVADAGRVADQVALTARPALTGYVRVANGPACARCMVLVGKTFRWNEGFQRHPRCDCVHLPISIARAAGLHQQPRALYDALSPAERTRAGFSAADQAAIADGADLSGVVNARRGMYTAGGRSLTTEGATRRGLYGGYNIDPETGRLTRRARGERAAPRLTPEQIYQEAAGDRDRAIRMLRQNGYLAERSVTPAAAAVPDRIAVDATASTVAPSVRSALTSASSIPELERRFAAEFETITGRSLAIDLGANASLITAAEHAEGILRVAEQFPDIPLSAVGRRVHGRPGAYAVAADAPVGQRIDFMANWTTAGDRADYLASLARGEASHWSPAGMASPVSIAMHEAIHVVEQDVPVFGRVRQVLEDMASETGRTVAELTESVSRYAATSMEELVAEAGADVLTNGEAAAAVSKRVMAALREGYASVGRRLPAVVEAAAQAVAEDLSRLTVAQLRALARERGVRIPSGARKADIVAMLQQPAEGRSLVQQGIGRQREIDAVSPVAERAIAVEQFLHDGGSLADAADLLDVEAEHDATVAKMLAAVRKPGTTPAAAIREIRRLAGTRGLKPISRAGASVAFNPAEQRSLGRVELAKGARVKVLQPGYAVTLASGERVILEKAIVAEVPAVAAATTDLTKMTVAQLRALAKERGVALRSADRKADILAKLRAGEGPAGPPGTGPLPNRQSKPITEIMGPLPPRDREADRQRILGERQTAIRAAVEGRYGQHGYRVVVVEGVASADQVMISGRIYNKAGEQVGYFTRAIGRGSDGSLSAEHVILQLDRRAQGSGFAQEFNRNLYDWYRRSGVRYVNVHANIDVGGYTWATQGYEFRDREAVREFLNDAQDKLDFQRRTPAGLTEGQMIELTRYVEDMRAGRVPVSAPQIAQFGRQPGQGGKGAMWPGKWLMLGSNWYGRLAL